MTEPTTATASASAPPAPTIDVTLPKVDWKMRRFFCWGVAAVLLGLIGYAIFKGQPAFAWPLVAVLGLDVMFYVGGATSTEIVQLVQSSGIIRAAQATAGAVTAAAEGVTAIAGRVLPAPTTGGRNDLAS